MVKYDFNVFFREKKKKAQAEARDFFLIDRSQVCTWALFGTDIRKPSLGSCISV